MIERIIFFVIDGFSERDYQRLGINILQQNNFIVEVWELTEALHPNYAVGTKDMQYSHKELAILKRKEEMKNRLIGLSKNDFVINMLNYNPWSLPTYRALGESQAEYGVTCANNLPVPQLMKRWSYILKRLIDLRKQGGLKIKERILSRIPFQFFRIKAARLVFSGGNESFTNQYPVDKNTEILKIHTLDYDLYLLEKKNPVKEKSIAVFLDDQFSIAGEYELFNEKPSIDTEKYFQLLNNFFDFVEYKTGLEVIIAAHPRSNYENQPDYFKGRKWFKGQTINLVKEARLVLAHFSTSINFANLFQKPLIFLTCSDISGSREDYWIEEMAAWHGKKPVCMDMTDEIDFDKELQISFDHYEKYRKSYIKSDESEELPFWQIVANRLKKGF